MSVTFSITNSPYTISHSECFCVYDGKAEEGCPWCQGTGMSEDREPAWPWVNLANTNARNVLAVLGFACDDELYGVWEDETLDVVIQRCLRALNSETRRAVATREEVYMPRGHAGVCVVREGNVARIERMGAETFVCGYSDETVQRRVREILDICRKAREEGEKVTWG